jgi:alkylhydroperoxidase family enzyme
MSMDYALRDVAWEPCLIEPCHDRALESYARRKQGIPNPAIGYFAPAPWLARGLIDLHPEYGLLMHLDNAVSDLVVLAVSQENSCRFCYSAVRAMLWAQGMPRARVQHLERELTRADLPPRTAAAIAFGRSQSRTGPPGALAARDALDRAGVGADEMREIAFAAANTDFSNRAHTILAVPTRPLERVPDQLHMRRLRPLIGRIIRKHTSRGVATPLDRVPSQPYTRLVRAYAGSPIAPAMVQVLDGMWASPHLTRRCKLLILAVVARGLGCEACAPELAESLQKEGLSEATLARVLTHLDAPELDPVERVLVPFARETIWFEPATIQRRARALRDRLSAVQILEGIGVAALANGFCRLGAAVLGHS